MTTKKHLLRSLYVLALVALWVVVDLVGLPHFVKSGIVGGLGASTVVWLLGDRAERQRRDRGVERR